MLYGVTETHKLSSEIKIMIEKIKNDNEQNVNINLPVSNPIIKQPNLKFEENSNFHNASKAVSLS